MGKAKKLLIMELLGVRFSMSLLYGVSPLMAASPFRTKSETKMRVPGSVKTPPRQGALGTTKVKDMGSLLPKPEDRSVDYEGVNEVKRQERLAEEAAVREKALLPTMYPPNRMTPPPPAPSPAPEETNDPSIFEQVGEAFEALINHPASAVDAVNCAVIGPVLGGAPC